MTRVAGEIVLVPLPRLGGVGFKLRPAVVLAVLPGPFQRVLLCGLSTPGLNDLIPNWDELLDPVDADFEATGLRRRSAVRPSYLYAAQEAEIRGVVGIISNERLEAVRRRVAEVLLTGS